MDPRPIGRDQLSDLGTIANDATRRYDSHRPILPEMAPEHGIEIGTHERSQAPGPYHLRVRSKSEHDEARLFFVVEALRSE